VVWLLRFGLSYVSLGLVAFVRFGLICFGCLVCCVGWMMPLFGDLWCLFVFFGSVVLLLVCVCGCLWVVVFVFVFRVECGICSSWLTPQVTKQRHHPTNTTHQTTTRWYNSTTPQHNNITTQQHNKSTTQHLDHK
jgi:hypothetical protein